MEEKELDLNKLIFDSKQSEREEAFRVYVKDNYPDLDGLPLDYLLEILKEENHPLKLTYFTQKELDIYFKYPHEILSPVLLVPTSSDLKEWEK